MSPNGLQTIVDILRPAGLADTAYVAKDAKWTTSAEHWMISAKNAHTIACIRRLGLRVEGLGLRVEGLLLRVEG